MRRDSRAVPENFVWNFSPLRFEDLSAVLRRAPGTRPPSHPPLSLFLSLVKGRPPSKPPAVAYSTLFCGSRFASFLFGVFVLALPFLPPIWVAGFTKPTTPPRARRRPLYASLPYSGPVFSPSAELPGRGYVPPELFSKRTEATAFAVPPSSDAVDPTVGGCAPASSAMKPLHTRRFPPASRARVFKMSSPCLFLFPSPSHSLACCASPSSREAQDPRSGIGWSPCGPVATPNAEAVRPPPRNSSVLGSSLRLSSLFFFPLISLFPLFVSLDSPPPLTKRRSFFNNARWAPADCRTHGGRPCRLGPVFFLCKPSQPFCASRLPSCEESSFFCERPICRDRDHLPPKVFLLSPSPGSCFS